MAAVLSCGSPAVLSHNSAAALWKLRETAHVTPEVSVPRSRAGIRGVRVHRSRTLTAVDRTRHKGIPVTSLPRTIVDLAGIVSRRPLERALDEAAIRHRVTAADVLAAIGRAPSARGSRLLREILDEGRLGCTLTRSELEERFLVLVRGCGLPEPEVNVRLRAASRYEVDFVWRDERVAVEVDGRAYHAMARAFERDRARDADLLGAGWPVIRYTWAKVTREPRWVERTLRAALERSGPYRDGRRGAPR
jgi:very-short-patch-repair endonuclease